MSRVWWVLFPVIAIPIIAHVRNEKNMNSNYSTATWSPLVALQAAKFGVDPKYVSQWIEMESGGQPCAIGKPGAKGPNGLPREMGIAQLYNPDDFDRFKLDPHHFRAYCDPKGNGNTIRLLTADEMNEQINGLFRLITFCRSYALQHLVAVGLENWSDHDVYCLTKLVHGLPGLVSGIGYVTKHLGHAPKNWSEFRDAVKTAKFDDGTERYRDSSNFEGPLKNAEKCASVLG